jgi:hypothetical protein
MSITLIDDQDNKLQIYKVDNSEESDRIAREKMLEEQRVIEEKRREEAAKLEEKKPVLEEKPVIPASTIAPSKRQKNQKTVVLTATFTFNDVDCSVPNDKIISFFERQLNEKLKSSVKINSVQSL